MPLIYSRASRTIFWLGSSNRNTEPAFDCASRFAKIRTELNASGVVFPHISEATELRKQYGLLKVPAWDKGIGTLMGLLKKTWFERVWVVQDVARSRSVSVIQGKFEVLWEDFIAAAILVWELDTTRFINDPILANAKTPFQIEAMRKKVKEDSVAPIKQILSLSRGMKATDPRDKIYALIGVSFGFPLRNAINALL